ncbi:hypothetical protein NDU88_005224 [Pleurodeles waltl]|uniref:Uncharacterized protein n=1 Tax=Pleurodeles waltl TaxID=8319 RepID=A0AAV7TUX0_PLEWA|nr:hypothetical protein NDU88_005224 [Pleurodeles waltl]
MSLGGCGQGPLVRRLTRKAQQMFVFCQGSHQVLFTVSLKKILNEWACCKMAVGVRRQRIEPLTPTGPFGLNLRAHGLQVPQRDSDETACLVCSQSHERPKNALCAKDSLCSKGRALTSGHQASTGEPIELISDSGSILRSTLKTTSSSTPSNPLPDEDNSDQPDILQRKFHINLVSGHVLAWPTSLHHLTIEKLISKKHRAYFLPKKSKENPLQISKMHTMIHYDLLLMDDEDIPWHERNAETSDEIRILP